MEAIERVIDDIKFQTKAKEKIRLDDVQEIRNKHREADADQFEDARAYNSVDVMNQQWMYKSLKKRKDKDVSATRKASHERFLKNVNQSFIRANGVGLN